MFAMFFVFEAGLRIAGGSEAAPVFQQLFMQDPAMGGYRLRPGAKARFRTTDFETDIAINSSGVRDREIPTEARRRAPDRRARRLAGPRGAGGGDARPSAPCSIAASMSGGPRASRPTASSTPASRATARSRSLRSSNTWSARWSPTWCSSRSTWPTTRWRRTTPATPSCRATRPGLGLPALRRQATLAMALVAAASHPPHHGAADCRGFGQRRCSSGLARRAPSTVR